MRPRAFLAVVLLTLLVTAACVARSNSAQQFRTAPNPTGCYAELFSSVQFTGTRDYVNGPWRMPDVRADRRWKDGVRSVRTGPATTVTFWSRDNYRGRQVQVGSDERNPRVINALGGAAASVQISCN